MVGFNDPLMAELSGPHKVRMLGAFMEAVRGGDFACGRKKSVQGTTASSAIDDVASEIKDRHRPNPRHDASGNIPRALNYQK